MVDCGVFLKDCGATLRVATHGAERRATIVFPL